MKRLLPYALLAALTLGAASTAEAKKKHRGDKHGWHHRDRSQTIYVIENQRPVRRVVYVDDRGGYYRLVDGRRSYVRGRYFSSYPSRYYYSDGRPRVGVSINF